MQKLSIFLRGAYISIEAGLFSLVQSCPKFLCFPLSTQRHNHYLILVSGLIAPNSGLSLCMKES